MRRLLVVLAAVAACKGEGEGSLSPNDPGDDPLDPTGTVPTEPPTVTDPPDPTTPVPSECEIDPNLSVVSITPSEGLITTLLQVEVELSVPATAAMQCTSVSDPSEVFFVEELADSASHTLRLSGLIPGTEYACSVAPICPAQSGRATSFSFTTDDPPGDMRRLSVVENPTLGMQASWTLAPFTLSAFGGDTWIVVWGPDGTVRWWYPAPDGVGMWIEALWYPLQGEFVWGGGMDEQGRIRRISMWDGETYAWAPANWQNTEFHHDGKQIADGRLLTLEIRENERGGENWDGFGIRLHDPVTGTIDFDYDSQVLVDGQYLPPGDGGFGGSDPWHANWVDYIETPTGPEVYVSLCFSWQILALDGTTGDLLWQLGRGLGWTVLDETGADIGEDALPQCQHGLEVVDGKILVYDNGQDRSKSSASEWEIDPVNLVATRLWYWTESGWQEDYIGDIDYLPNDRILVTEATQMGDSEIVEVDRLTGEVASRLKMDNGGSTYRAQQYLGCEMFSSAKECDTLAARYAVVAPLLAP
jgi:hypothetical protein